MLVSGPWRLMTCAVEWTVDGGTGQRVSTQATTELRVGAMQPETQRGWRPGPSRLHAGSW